RPCNVLSAAAARSSNSCPKSRSNNGRSGEDANVSPLCSGSVVAHNITSRKTCHSTTADSSLHSWRIAPPSSVSDPWIRGGGTCQRRVVGWRFCVYLRRFFIGTLAVFCVWIAQDYPDWDRRASPLALKTAGKER